MPQFIASPESQTARITFLGTGSWQGIPALGCSCSVCEEARIGGISPRSRCSLLLQYEDNNVLIDASPDLWVQLTSSGIKCVDAILISHAHPDHMFGLQEFRDLKNDIPIFCSRSTADSIEEFMTFIQKLGSSPSMTINVVEAFSIFMIGPIGILPLPMDHGIVGLGMLGFRFTFGGHKVVYLADTAPIMDHNIFREIYAPEVLIVNSPHLVRKDRHISIEEVAGLSETLAAKQTFINHISHTVSIEQQITQLLSIKGSVLNVPVDNLVVDLNDDRIDGRKHLGKP